MSKRRPAKSKSKKCPPSYDPREDHARLEAKLDSIIELLLLVHPQPDSVSANITGVENGT